MCWTRTSSRYSASRTRIEGNWKESRHRCIRLPDGTTTTGVPTAKGRTIPMERSTCGKLAEEPTSQTFLDFLAEQAQRAVDSERSTRGGKTS
ncbi:hypothetical protein T07_4413 [Trichinella nelsoni]|uniref:Uncharacterized protein n=1 Tax=Trichinella nelsoni TaxID=6336 RepID=A0A0V0SLC8_9BILA|nr:hypothetical protein T07_4413 [Trichinella nelsoni]